jgi:hypothetical protein
MTGPRRPNYPAPAEPPDNVIARFETVAASESETGLDETYVVFDGKRIAKRGQSRHAPGRDVGVTRARFPSSR